MSTFYKSIEEFEARLTNIKTTYETTAEECKEKKAILERGLEYPLADKQHIQNQINELLELSNAAKTQCDLQYKEIINDFTVFLQKCELSLAKQDGDNIENTPIRLIQDTDIFTICEGSLFYNIIKKSNLEIKPYYETPMEEKQRLEAEELAKKQQEEEELARVKQQEELIEQAKRDELLRIEKEKEFAEQIKQQEIRTYNNDILMQLNAKKQEIEVKYRSLLWAKIENGECFFLKITEELHSLLTSRSSFNEIVNITLQGYDNEDYKLHKDKAQLTSFSGEIPTVMIKNIGAEISRYGGMIYGVSTGLKDAICADEEAVQSAMLKNEKVDIANLKYTRMDIDASFKDVIVSGGFDIDIDSGGNELYFNINNLARKMLEDTKQTAEVKEWIAARDTHKNSEYQFFVKSIGFVKYNTQQEENPQEQPKEEQQAEIAIAEPQAENPNS